MPASSPAPNAIRLPNKDELCHRQQRIAQTMSIDELRSWIGRHETRDDVATVAPLVGMAAALDRVTQTYEAGDDVPPLWHWTYFLPSARNSTRCRWASEEGWLLAGN